MQKWKNQAALSLLVVALPVHAQVEGGRGETRTTALEEVMVTAQRRVESLQDAPISISVMDSGMLETLGIEDLADIGLAVPNLTVRPFPQSNSTMRVFIRGIGANDVQVTRDPTVGIYVNDVYISRSTGMVMDVADLQSVQVLRGPQGTLFGRNAAGGALKIDTVPADTEAFSFKQGLGTGNRDRRRSHTMVNMPLGDAVAAKMVYLFSSKDGYLENTGPGKNFYDQKDEGGRLDLRWLASDSVTVDYAWDFANGEVAAPTYQSTRYPSNSPVGAYNKGYYDESLPGFTGPSAIGAYMPVFLDQQRADSLSTILPLLPSDTEIDGHSLTVAWETDGLIIKSISAYREMMELRYADLGLGSWVIRTGDYDGYRIPVSQDQYSQEFQFIGELDRLNYNAGLYYFKEHAGEGEMRRKLAAVNLTSLDPADYENPSDTLYMNTWSVDYGRAENSAWASYGQLTYTPALLEDRLHFTLGARYTEDKRAATVYTEVKSYEDGFPLGAQDNTTLAIQYASVNGSASDQFHDFSYEFVTAFDWSDDVSSYFKIATAYKAGGYNFREGNKEQLDRGEAQDPQQVAALTAQTTAQWAKGFGPEDITSYELGMKAEFFERRLRVNGAVYYVEYEEIQLDLSIPETGTPADTNVFNAGVATVDGAELDITAVLLEGLTGSLQYGYTHGVFTDAEDPRSGSLTEPEFVFVGAPLHSFAASLDYQFPAFSFGLLDFNVNYSWQDSYHAAADASGVGENRISERTEVPAFGLLNARLQLSEVEFAQGSWQLALWAKNIENKDYVVDAVAIFATSDRALLYGEPRSYGLDLTYLF